jgi:hypothetical protein
MDPPRIGRIARWLAIMTPVPFLVGFAMSGRSERAIGLGFLGSVAVGFASLAVGTIAWGRVRTEASALGLLLWLVFGGGLIAFLVTMALAWRNWAF